MHGEPIEWYAAPAELHTISSELGDRGYLALHEVALRAIRRSCTRNEIVTLCAQLPRLMLDATLLEPSDPEVRELFYDWMLKNPEMVLKALRIEREREQKFNNIVKKLTKMTLEKMKHS
jgi:uncharacterized protein (DUF2267 family)